MRVLGLASRHPWIRRVCCILLFPLPLLGLNGCTNVVTVIPQVVSAGPTPQTMWVAVWTANAQNATSSSQDPGGSEQSFRFIVLPTTDATQERVHFSNRLGTTSVTIGAARLAVAVDVGPAIDPKRDAALTFSGATSITLAPGQEIVSDPVNVSYNFGEKLAVSMYMKGSFPSLTEHASDVQFNFQNASGAGNATSDTSGASMGTVMTDWLLLSGIDAYGSYQGSVAIFGSSSVDGHASNYGNSNSYPTANVAITSQDNDRPSDWLARQMRAAGYRVGVSNAGLLGNAAAGTGGGVDRMQHDVLGVINLKTVIIYFGGIDLRGNCVQATDVESSLSNMVQQANAAGIRVILATIPPSEYCTTTPGLVPTTEQPYLGDLIPGPENPGSTQRRAVNDWIRSTAVSLPGVVGVADFDKALADPNHPDFMIPNLNSGDNFHPNGVGYGVQSSSIPLDKILGQ
ncbi:Lysophospholipase L1 [Terriglobus roseus]|uniref:Lysophospholipase L1 n=1 Tax=Terriglobus roseus TaxID=392734 RepID=A0A1G7M6V7_9BACT|nr:Lysophospholipase L1 [Terriglobus roseus]